MSARISILQINLASKPEKSYARKLDKDTRELRLTVQLGKYSAKHVDLYLPHGIKASEYVNDDGSKVFTIDLPRHRRKATVTLINTACPKCESPLPSFAIPITLTADRPSPEGTILPL